MPLTDWLLICRQVYSRGHLMKLEDVIMLQLTRKIRCNSIVPALFPTRRMTTCIIGQYQYS